MAKCTVTQAPLPPPPPKTYVLELNETEAAAIRALTGAINSTGSVREATNSIYEALRVAGVPDGSSSPREVGNHPCFSVETRPNWIALNPTAGSKYHD